MGNNQCLAAQSDARQEIVHNFGIYNIEQNLLQSFDRSEWDKYNLHFTIDNCLQFSRSGIILFRRPIINISNLIYLTFEEYGITVKPYFYNKQKPQTVEEHIRSSLELIFSNEILKDFFMERVDVKQDYQENFVYLIFYYNICQDSQKDFSLPGNRKFISQQYLSRKVDINEKDYQFMKSFNLTINTKSQHNQQGDQTIFISQNSPFKKDENSFQHNQTLPNYNDQQSTSQSPLQKNKIKFSDNQQVFENRAEHNQVLLTEQLEQLNNQQTQNKINISQFNINNNQENLHQNNNFQKTDQMHSIERVYADPRGSQNHIQNKSFLQQKQQYQAQVFKNNTEQNQVLQKEQFEQLNNQQTQDRVNMSQFNNNNQENLHQNNNFQKTEQMPKIERANANPRISQINIQNESFFKQNEQQQVSQLTGNLSLKKVEPNLSQANLQQKQFVNLDQQIKQSFEIDQNQHLNLQNQQQIEQFDVQQVDENLFGTFSKNKNQQNVIPDPSTASFNNSQQRLSFQQQSFGRINEQSFMLQNQHLKNQQDSSPNQIINTQQSMKQQTNQSQSNQNNSNGFQVNQYQTPIKNMQQQLVDNNSNQIRNTSQFYDVHSTPFTKDKQNNSQKTVTIEDHKMNTQGTQFREAKEFNLNPSQNFEVGNKSFQESQKQLFPIQEIIIAERDSVNHYYDYTDTEKHANQYQPMKETGSYVNQFQFKQQQQQIQYEKSFQFTNNNSQNQLNSTIHQNTSKKSVQNFNLNLIDQQNQQQNQIQFNISAQKDNQSQNRGPIFIENQQPEINLSNQLNNQAEFQKNDQQQDQPYSTDRSLYFKRQKKALNNIINPNTLSNNQQVKIQ